MAHLQFHNVFGTLNIILMDAGKRRSGAPDIGQITSDEQSSERKLN